MFNWLVVAKRMELYSAVTSAECIECTCVNERQRVEGRLGSVEREAGLHRAVRYRAGWHGVVGVGSSG